MSKVLAVANFKGGCGKTTSAIDLAVAFVKLGKKVLAVDSDSQGHLTIGFGFPKSQRVTLKDMLENEIMGYEYDPREAVLTSEEGVDVIPSNKLVSGIALNSADSPELVLKGYIDKLRDLYEVIIIDCSPAFGMMNINVLAAADGVIIPTKAEYFGIDGLQEIIGSVRSIKKRFNPDLKIEGILFTMDTGRFNNTKRNKEAVRNAYGDEINIYDLTIPNAVAIAEAASEGVSIHSYSGNSQGAKNYLEIAKGCLQMAKTKKEIVLNKDYDNSLDEILMDGGLKEKINRDEIKEIPIDKLRPFKNHPFKVIDDDKMDELVESIRDNGIMSPVIVRPSGDMYELISGHRRTHAAVRAGLSAVPAVIRDLNDDEATVLMVDANIQREFLYPSERAKSLKMKIDSLNNLMKYGARKGVRSRDIAGKDAGITGRQVQKLY